MPLPFVVACYPKSGTRFTAEALTALGLRCTHEQRYLMDRVIGWGEQLGDASLHAVRYLSCEQNVRVLHQTRHPLRAMEAVLANTVHDRHSRALWVVSGYHPTQDPPQRAWIAINKIIERGGAFSTAGYMRYRVEDFVEVAPQLVLWCNSHCGAVSLEKCRAVVDKVGRNSTREDGRFKYPSLSWNDFRDDAEFLDLAAAYGYEPQGV